MPSPVEPELRIFKDDEGRWGMERDGVVTAVHDEDVVVAGRNAYVLHLPDEREVQATRPSSRGIDDIKLTFRVSRDEEHVELWVEHPGGHVEVLPPRAHYYSLLQLARIRLKCERLPEVPEPARGWVSVSELCRMLAYEESRLNVDIYRVRRDLAKTGISDAPKAIERQRARCRLRLCPQRVSITMM